MQNSSRQAYSIYPLPPVEPIPNWNWNHRVTTHKNSMDIGGLVNGNARYTNESQMRQMHPNLNLDMQFGINHNAGMMNHIQQHGMTPNHAINYSPIGQIQHPMMPSNISPVSQASYTDNDPGSPKTKSEAVKSFKCSNTDCDKAFARRSDLARHGETQSFQSVI